MYPDEEQRITTGVARRIGLVLATGLVTWGFQSSTAVQADHLSPKHDPWTQPWELERLALLDVPEGMVPVPGGPFLGGSDPKVDRAAGPQGQPQRPVYLGAFEIDRYEVTNVHYLRFVLATGKVWPPFWMQDPFLEKNETGCFCGRISRMGLHCSSVGKREYSLGIREFRLKVVTQEVCAEYLIGCR